jgi:dipeptidyl aminopeptidase/acylaminoacyl peptidase
MPLDGDRKPQVFLNTDADESSPKFSPDGRWLAYSSDETSRNEIYVRPIGAVGGRRIISTGGGTWPAWNPNGRELFFVKGDKLLAVTVDAQMNRIAPEHIVVDAPTFGNLHFQADFPYYDVMPDGDHFVMLLTPQYPPPTHYNVVVNWIEELKQRVH